MSPPSWLIRSAAHMACWRSSSARSVNSPDTWARSLPAADMAWRLYRIQHTISVASTSLRTEMTSAGRLPEDSVTGP